MRDNDYILLKNMIERNKLLYKNGDFTFEEYLDNHIVLMSKLKNSILKMEQSDFAFLLSINSETSFIIFRQGMEILKYSPN